MYHSVEVNDVDIIHTSLDYISPSKQHCSPVIHCSEGEHRTWRRSLSSGSRTAPHTCSKVIQIILHMYTMRQQSVIIYLA